MNIAILPNLDKCKASDCLSRVVDILSSLSVNIGVMNDVYNYMTNSNISKHNLNCVQSYNNINSMFSNCDIAITIGGDGTIIHASKHAAENNKPILGINLGRLGFVSGIEYTELDRLKDLVEGKYKVEKRMMLDVSVKCNEEIKKFYALNDVVVSRGSLLKIIDIDVSFNDNNMSHYRADGIIVATPTGSSAYSLSAGGPVIEPNVRCMLLTPICSHSLFSRSVIFNDLTTLSIQAYAENNDISLAIDGDNPIKIYNGDIVDVKASSRYVELIKLKYDGFYQILSKKLQV